MTSPVTRRRWVAWGTIAAIAFQALVLVLQTPMAVARGLGATVAQVGHCETEEHPTGHHGGPAKLGDACSLCLGVQIASHGVVPVAPALPIPVLEPESSILVSAVEAPGLARRTPQNPRAPPFPV